MSAAANVGWTLLYWVSRTGVGLGRFLPTRLCYAVAGPIAGLCFLLMARPRRNLIENLTRVVGPEEAPKVARQVFHNFGRYIIDFYQLSRRGRKALQQRIAFADWHRLDEALDEPKGTLFVTIHLGQIELGAAAVGSYGHRVNVVAETLRHPPMDEFIQGLRASLGMKVIAAKKAQFGVMRCLNRGEVLVTMLDAYEPGQSVVVDFFGAPAEVASAPARVALRTGARVLPAVIGRAEGSERLIPLVDFDLNFQPAGDEERDVQVLSQTIATSLEGFVRRFPEQWFAFRPVWGTATPAKQPQRWRLWALQTGFRLGGVLPRLASYALARLAADTAFRFRHGARRDVMDNMRHVMGADASPAKVEVAAREAFRNVARYYVDLIRLPQTKPEQLMKLVRIHGLERLKSRLDAGKGVIVATAHFGNPEVAVQVGAILGLKLLVLAEPLQPPAFAELMDRMRSAHGTRYVDVGFSGVAEAIRHLRGGGCLAITCDRDVQGKGVPLPFFGATTKMPLGAVELAARTGAVLIPGYCRRSGAGFHVYFEEPIELVSSGRPREDALVNARSLIARAEVWIASDPGQWMVLERIWRPVEKTTPDALLTGASRLPAGRQG
jgi:KDO2-lipid IV(A) lauroyltransferase